MRVETRVRIGNGEIYMGKGVRELLQAIDAHQSIKQACVQTSLSYPKAMRMLKTFEQEVGVPAVRSQKGGQTYGGTQLTPQGRAVLEAYCEIEEKVAAYAKALAEETFPTTFTD